LVRLRLYLSEAVERLERLELLADEWTVYDNSRSKPRVLEQDMKKKPSRLTLAVGRALRRAAKTARKTARAHGTPIYIWKNGKVVAEKP
jgi:hypothetical protein